MADVLPSIRVTDSQSKSSRPATAVSAGNSPKSTDFYDAEEYKISSYLPQEEANQSAVQTVSTRNKKPSPTSPNGTTPSATTDSNDAASASQEPPVQSAIDPLSEHIRKRASPQTQKSRRASASGAEAVSPVISRDNTSKKNSFEGPRNDSSIGGSKDKKKSVPFLSRFRPGKKKDSDQELKDTDDAEQRPEGADAQLFFESVDNMGYSPKYPQPPGYIKVHAQGKKDKDFNRLFLAQELKDKEPRTNVSRTPTISSVTHHGKTKMSNAEATWALEFSKDGRYLATAGQDKLVRVWATLSSREERRMHEKDEEAREDQHGLHEHLSAPVFRGKPLRLYEGHTSPVLDLSWSKNNFLLSSSMDKTVRLWHVSRAECLCAFKHTDFVTSIVFHPKDDRFFLAGSLDSKLRLWSIPDKSVAYWTAMPEMCTAVAFTPDGKSAIAGCLTGLCLFYETEGLKYQTQIHAKSTYGKNARGSKITGIQTISMPATGSSGDVKVLITTNDSRVRMYNLRDKSLEIKFKGNENTASQIYASFSDDAKHVICGSEDKKVFIWSLNRTDPEKKDHQPFEVFEAHNAATTVCAIAPTRTRQLLSSSEDPIFDICNPPPVTLMSKSEVESVNSSVQLDDAGSIQPTPATAEGTGSFKRPEESPAYIARSSHVECGGNIVVTADVTGYIKVFRQDCAFNKRMRSDSDPFYHRFSAVDVIRRHSSLATQSSSRSRSRKGSATTQPSRERILSWRQSISNGNNTDSPKISPSPHPDSSRRNASPRMSIGGRFSHRSLLGENGRSAAGSKTQISPSASASGLGIITSGSPSISTQESQSPHESSRSNNRNRAQTNSSKDPAPPSQPSANTSEATSSASSPHSDGSEGQADASAPNEQTVKEDEHISPVLAREKSLQYWNNEAWHDAMASQVDNARYNESLRVAESAADGHLQRPGMLGVSPSYRSSISALSSEMSSASGDEKPAAAASPSSPAKASSKDEKRK